MDERIAELERETGMRYAAQQKEAIRLACERRLLAVTGGPGTGKTTIIQAILRLYDDMQLDCLLAAPTGRAAKRMTELTGREAYTIHRLLGAAWAAEGDELTFRKNESDPLRCGAVILDECSMVDITLIQALLKALPKGCRLVLVGDADQLPSVGPGSFFLDVLRSHAVAAVRLTEIFRQSGESRIIRNAHSINRGETPELRENKGDFFFFAASLGRAFGRDRSRALQRTAAARYGYPVRRYSGSDADAQGRIRHLRAQRALTAVAQSARARKKRKNFWRNCVPGGRSGDANPGTTMI